MKDKARKYVVSYDGNVMQVFLTNYETRPNRWTTRLDKATLFDTMADAFRGLADSKPLGQPDRYVVRLVNIQTETVERRVLA